MKERNVRVHELRILNVKIKQRVWQSPKHQNWFLKPQWALASTYICLYLVWNISKFCMMPNINHLNMNGCLLLPSPIESAHWLRHNQWPCHVLKSALTTLVQGVLGVPCPLMILSELLSRQQLFLLVIVSLVILDIYIFMLSLDFLHWSLYKVHGELWGYKWLCFIFFSCVSFPVPTSSLPLGLLQCLMLGNPYNTFVVQFENHDTVSQPFGTLQLHWDRTIFAPKKASPPLRKQRQR